MLKLWGKKGSSLVELMVAVLLFGLVMGGVLDLSIQTISMGKRSQMAYTAYNLSKNHIETLKSMPFSNLVNAAETDTRIDGTGSPVENGLYLRNTEILSDYTGDANLVKIQVDVNYYWKGSLSANTTKLTTVIYASA